jgi:NADP-dependent 3-hydroxy acid dehydrogenase YdfG
MPKKADPVWFVTGASSGFGRALGEAILERGQHLVATGPHLEEIEALASNCASTGASSSARPIRASK